MIFDYIFGNTVTRKVEKKNKIDGQVEVLKKKQKVESEKIIHEYEDKKTATIDNITATINALQAQIASLKISKDTKCQMLDEERKVKLDKIINDFNIKIVNKQNQSKRLTRYIEAEMRNMEDATSHPQPNAPTTQSTSAIGFIADTKTKSTSKKSK